MRLLCFGATGQVARELARLDLGGDALVQLSRAEADLSDPDACAAAVAAHRPDAVINAAAWTDVDGAEAQEGAARVVNGDAPAAIARACAALGAPLVHISTDYVFAGGGAAPWRPGDAVAPLGAYGRTKLLGEEGVRAAGGPHAILRTSWVFSAHGRNFARTMLRLGAERERLRVVDDQIGGPTPAAGIAAACTAIARRLRPEPDLSGTYHFAGAPDVSWAGFAREIMARAGLPCDVEGIPSAEYPTPARRPLNSRLDCAATEAAFGVARPDWRAGLDAIIEELRSQ